MLQKRQQGFHNRISASVDCLSDHTRCLDGFESETPEMMLNVDSSCSDMSIGWYSLAGYLNVKFLGGALTLLRPKRKFYFVLDEANVQLAYFKDETDFIRKRSPAGSIELKNCAVTISETKHRAFILHAIGGRQYELEADSDQCALVWLHCLQNRGCETPTSLDDSIKSQRSKAVSQNLSYQSSYHSAVDQQAYSNNSDSSMSSNSTTSAYFYCSDGKKMSTSSLPSDADMAAALDSALKCCVDRSMSLNDYNAKGRKTATKEVVNRPGFYLDASSLKSDNSDGPTMPNGNVKSDDEEEPDEDNNSELSENAKSLQAWIKDWLRTQSRTYSMENGDADMSPTRDEPVNNECNFQNNESKSPPTPNGKQALTAEQEVLQFRKKERRYKLQIQQLNMRIKDMQRQLEQTQRYVHQAPELHVKFLQHQNKFLNAEILRLSTRWQGEQGQFVKLTSKITTLMNDLDKFKMDYVSLLQSCVRVALGERHREGTEVKLYGGDTHKIRIHQLIDEARQTDPSLPILENLTSGNGHVDVYGFRHFFADENLAIHYMSTQLHQYYTSQTSYQNRHRWKLHLNRVRRGVANTKETRALMRLGIPTPYRSSIWRCLVHQKIADLKFQHGKYYFKNLCSAPSHAPDLENNNTLNQKQITLDLMRTMPNNVHFANSTCKGISQLQQVLHAFCIHNPRIGYCQGMNFLAAVCLLFLSPEDTFWFLVALTERYFLPSYFDQTLTGVQADQEVLKWLVEQKLPALAHHLQLCDIDLATITLNWFLALFFDSLPFETMLRVWDCFLLEGPKILFRFALALLSMHQDALMERSDTMSILKVLKIATKFTYDIEGLTKIAFEGLKPFPRRQELLGRQTTYIKILKEKLRQKEEFKAVALGVSSFSIGDLVQIGVAVSAPGEGHCLLTFGHQNNGRLGVILNGSTILRIFDVQFNCRILNMVVSDKILFISLISGYLAAIKVDCESVQSKNLWEIRLADMALELHLVDDNRLLATLANGSLAVLENCTTGTPSMLELYYIPVGPAPITCIAADGDGQLWCGMGCKVFVFNEHTLDCIERLVVANSINGNCAAIFDRLVGVKNSDRGMWLAVANSSLLQLWDVHHFTCKLLYDISKDSAGLHKKADDTAEAHITSLLNCGDTVWIGTANGYMLMYQIHENYPQSALKLSKISPCTSLRNSARFKDISKRSRSPVIAAKEPTKDVQKLPLTNRDSGYSTSSSNNGASAVRRLSQSFPNFDFASLAKRWQSCESLSSPGQKRTQIPLEEAIDETNPLDSPPRPLDSPPHSKSTSANTVRLQKRYTKASASKPFNETVNRRRKSLGSIGIAQPFVGSSEDEIRSDLLNRQRSSSVRLSSVQSPSLEFDDLFFLYDEDKASSDKLGGLCTSRLNNTDSEWSIMETMLFPWREDNSPLDERSYDAEKFVNYTMKRPSSLELRRKDLQSDDMFNMEKLDGGPNLDDTETNLLSPSANYFASSETASVISCNSVESPFVYSLNLLMRLKISDKPVNNLTLCGDDNKRLIVSCAGSFGDSESILIWSPEENKILWTNEPATIETPGGQKPTKLQARRKTLAWFRS